MVHWLVNNVWNSYTSFHKYIFALTNMQRDYQSWVLKCVCVFKHIHIRREIEWKLHYMHTCIDGMPIYSYWHYTNSLCFVRFSPFIEIHLHTGKRGGKEHTLWITDLHISCSMLYNILFSILGTPVYLHKANSFSMNSGNS